MLRHLILSTALVAASLPAMPAPALAAGSFAQPGNRNCEQTPARATRRSVLGGLGSIGRSLLGSNRVTRVIESAIPVQSMLTDALLDMLDCDEQQKAVKATEDATLQAETRGVGASVAWRSESRPGVSGTSTVTALDAPPASANGRRCMTVTDVVIVDGEETSLPKRMCRVPPSTRYARV